jgi:hypothetical protein
MKYPWRLITGAGILLALLVLGISLVELSQERELEMPERIDELHWGTSYILSWDGQYHLDGGVCEDTGNRNTLFLALDAFDSTDMEVSVRGVGFVENEGAVVRKICGHDAFIGFVEIYPNESSPNGWGVLLHLLDEPVPVMSRQ